MKAPHSSQRGSLGVVVVVCGLTLLSPGEAKAAVNYSLPGSAYSQNFDSLPNTPQNTSLGGSPAGWTDDNASPGSNSSIVGWYLYHPNVQGEGGASGYQRLRIGAGTANTGSFMSWGASGSTDRALGSLASNTMATNPTPNMYFGLRLHNDTGATLSSFTLTYDGEQWRDGGAATPNAQSLAFTWSTTATALNDSDTLFNVAPALDFTSPVLANTGSGAAVDGNVAGLVAGISATVSDINWSPGTDLWLRWADLNNTGNDHGLGIDNLTFMAIVPEPSIVALLGLGAAAMLAVRRRN